MKHQIVLVNMLQKGIMMLFLSALLVVGMLLGVGMVEAAPFAYVANRGSNDVSVIDTANNIVVGTPITVGISPTGVAITPDGKRVYVTNDGFPGTVSVIDTASNTVVGTPIAVGNGPAGIAIIPDGKFAYVANFFDAIPPDFSSTVSVIDTTTNTVVDTIDVGFEPTQVAISPDGKHAYVANGGDGTVSMIETATNTVVGNAIIVGGLPEGITITPDGKKVYVTNFNSHDVSVIDTTSNFVQTTIPVGFFPLGIAITPDGQRVYVADTDRATNNGSLTVIDTASDMVIARVVLPPNSVPMRLAITHDGKHAYVTINFPGTILVIDTASNTVVGAPIMVGSIPEGIAITPAVSMPFATFNPKVILLRNTHGNGHFSARGSLTLADTSDGIDPEAETMVFSIADMDGTFFTEIVPPGSFKRIGKRSFLFRAPKESAGIRFMIIRPTTSVGEFTFEILGKKLDLSGADDPPVTVSLQIRNDAGTETVPCQNLSKVLICQ